MRSALASTVQRLLILDPLPERSVQQAQGLQGLAQVVAGGGEEARLGKIGLFRRLLGGQITARRA